MLFIYDSRFDEIFGELVDDLVAVLGDDALVVLDGDLLTDAAELVGDRDRKSTRLNSSHVHLHSFPTRRSSDLRLHQSGCRI